LQPADPPQSRLNFSAFWGTVFFNPTHGARRP
jgi:hypothetical protein